MVRKKITIEDIKKMPEADLLVNHVVDRRRKGLYSLILVHGLPGTGKSSQCFRLKELIQKEFPNMSLKFNIVEKLHELASFTQESKEDELCICIIEELSTLFPARRAMATDNVDVLKILDTCRKKKIIILANAPIWTSIDSHIRMMGNVYIETIKVYKGEGVVISRFYRLQTNPQSGKTYTHSFLRNRKEVTRLYTLMPDLNVWNEYEKKKDKFMDALYTKIKARAIKREEKENKELGLTPKPMYIQKQYLTKKEMQAHELININKLSQTEAAKQLGVSVACVCNRIKSVNSKMGIIPESRYVNIKDTRAQ